MSTLDPEACAAGNPFWQFCKTVYQTPGVEDVLLTLQDAHEADVLMILFCCWLATRDGGLEVNLDDALRVSQAFQPDVVAPLRQVRRTLKEFNAAQVDGSDLVSDAEAVRTQIKQAELCMEALQTRALAQFVSDLPPVEMLNAERAKAEIVKLIERYFGLAGLDVSPQATAQVAQLAENIARSAPSG